MKRKYLIVLAGSPRGGEKTWESMYKYLLNNLDADLAICCGEDINDQTSLYKNAKYKWLFEEYDNWLDYYKNNSQLNALDYFNKGIETGLYNSGSVHFAIKDIILKNYLDILKEYEYIIYTRFDQFYIDYHPEIYDDSILIPEGEDYFGVCDRHAVFPSKYSEDILNICNFINSEEALKNLGDYVNCETTYFNHLKYLKLDKKIKRIKRFQFTTSNEGDRTRWRVAKYNLWFVKGIKLKYPYEFVKSFKNRVDKYSFMENVNNSPLLYINYVFLLYRKLLSPFFPKKVKNLTTEYVLKEK